MTATAASWRSWTASTRSSHLQARGDAGGPAISRGVDALGAPWPDPAREVEVPPRGEPMPADVDRAWDMCDVCGDLLAYPEWRRRCPEAVEHHAREPRGW